MGWGWDVTKKRKVFKILVVQDSIMSLQPVKGWEAKIWGTQHYIWGWHKQKQGPFFFKLGAEFLNALGITEYGKKPGMYIIWLNRWKKIIQGKMVFYCYFVVLSNFSPKGVIYITKLAKISRPNYHFQNRTWKLSIGNWRLHIVF